VFVPVLLAVPGVRQQGEAARSGPGTTCGHHGWGPSLPQLRHSGGSFCAADWCGSQRLRAAAREYHSSPQEFPGIVAGMKTVKIVVEKHPDGYVAYPLGLKGAVVGEGDSYDQVLADCRSAVRFHVESFGPEVLDTESPVLEAFIAEAHA
jgi:hypothetical protein